MRIRETFAATGLLTILIAACGAALNDADKVVLARDGVEIGVCEERAKACKEDAGYQAAVVCWPVFDRCLVEKGIDGGRHVR